MASTTKKWLLGCGLGCGIPVLLVIVVSIVGGIRMMKPFDAAVDTQNELTAAHGAREDWSPLVDGLTADRMERFLSVRAAMEPLCAEFEDIAGRFRRMDELDSQEDAGKVEILKAVGRVTGGVFRFPGQIGRLNEVRNQALLDAGMGLGEYTWIYVLAYNSDLGHTPNRDIDGDPSGGHYADRERELIRGLMNRHADALADAGRMDEAGLWRAEIARLEDEESNGVPFPDGDLPAEVADPLAPYRARLDSLYCAATSSFELGRVKRSGLKITSE